MQEGMGETFVQKVFGGSVCTLWLYPKCAISQIMKSQVRSVLQYNAMQDLILISKKLF